MSGKELYYAQKRKCLMFVLVFAVVAVIVFGASMSIGYYEIGFTDVYRLILDHLTGNITDPEADDIIWNTRLPIAVFALIAGASLSVAGAVMQTAVRNPLADPYTMGIASGAGLGASLAIIGGVSLWEGLGSAESLVTMAFVFSLIPTAIIMAVSLKRSVTPSKMVLVGVAVMYVFSAATTLLMLTGSDEKLQDVFSWNVGSLALISWEDIPIPLIVTLISLTVLMLESRKINVLMSGPVTASTLGVDSKRFTLFLLLVVSLMTASVVSFCGTIGFVGLVGPHIARVFVGSETRYLLPASAAVGGFFLLFANSVARVSGGFGLPVGVVSAIIGCPIFIFILVKMKRRVWM